MHHYKCHVTLIYIRGAYMCLQILYIIVIYYYTGFKIIIYYLTPSPTERRWWFARININKISLAHHHHMVEWPYYQLMLSVECLVQQRHSLAHWWSLHRQVGVTHQSLIQSKVGICSGWEPPLLVWWSSTTCTFDGPTCLAASFQVVPLWVYSMHHSANCLTTCFTSSDVSLVFSLSQNASSDFSMPCSSGGHF